MNLKDIEQSIITTIVTNSNISPNGEIEKYVKEGYSSKQIANLLNLTTRQVTTYRNHKNIGVGRKGKKTGKALKPTEKIKQLIIGSLLGDGCIDLNNRERNYCRLVIKHGYKQEEYARYKYNFLKSFCKTTFSYSEKEDTRDKFQDTQKSFNIVTTTDPLWSEYRKKWYDDNGLKRVNEKDLYNLDLFGLAIWIMDDGYTDGKTIILSTNGFIKEDLELIQDFFADNNIKTTIQPSNGVLRISVYDIDYLIKSLDDYIIPSMRYKCPSKIL